MRQGLAQLLELHGFLVADASNGEDALEQLTSDPKGFALILLDLMLPGAISGRDLRVRQLADPVLGRADDRRLGVRPGSPERVGLRPDAWLDKPYRFDDLLELVKRYVVSEGSALAGVHHVIGVYSTPRWRRRAARRKRSSSSGTGRSSDTPIATTNESGIVTRPGFRSGNQASVFFRMSI